MGDTSIEWTDAVWNPTRGCSRISPGCEHCYAEVMAGRFSKPGLWGHGFAVLGKSGARWTRKVTPVPDKLDLPLHWREPKRIFVNSTSDLFHEDVDGHFIARVFDVMARCPQHTFQVLTKRAERMAAWFETASGRLHGLQLGAGPLPNVWLGVSVEDQKRADERIPHLLRTPAAVRFLSVEPLLERVTFRWARWLKPAPPGGSTNHLDGLKGIGWVIVGGESGRGARTFDVRWAREIVAQCQTAHVPVFVKQLGAFCLGEAADVEAVLDAQGRGRGTCPPGSWRLALAHPKGGDMAEWPAALRIREFPVSPTTTTRTP